MPSRPFYKDEEIENTCAEELARVGLMPYKPESIRIDRFVEKRFGIAHEYEDLPEGLLGYTRFGQRGVEAIIVASSLEDGSESSARRLRSTLAHEAGHGLFHAHLFLEPGVDHRQLFADVAHNHSPRVLCREIVGIEGARRRYNGEWWEFHANRAIGALLIPRPLLHRALDPLVEQVGGIIGGIDLPTDKRNEAELVISQVFDVNPVVARFRIEQFYPVSASLQGRL